jgi:hypothetical protein
VCHDDLVGLVEDEVAGTGEFGQPGPYRRDIERQLFGEVVCTRRAPGARERAVDGKPKAAPFTVARPSPLCGTT